MFKKFIQKNKKKKKKNGVFKLSNIENYYCIIFM